MMIFDSMFKKKGTGNVAKDRLKLVLVSDRAGCSPEIMEKMKNEIIYVISKYIEIDTAGLDFKFKNDPDGTNALCASIPIKETKQSKRA